MMVAGGLNLETGLALQPGAAPGQGVAPDGAFTDILAALETGAIPAPVAEAVAIMPAAALAVAAPSIEDVSEDAPAEEAADQDDASEADETAVATVVPPFVAPPIAITVSGASPIVSRPGFVPQPADSEVATVRQQTAPSISITASPADPESAVAMAEGAEAMILAETLPAKTLDRSANHVAVQTAARGSRAAAPVLSSAATLAQAADAAPAGPAAVSAATLPIGDGGAEAAGPLPSDAPAAGAPIVPPLPAVATTAPEALSAGDAIAADTAGQLGEQSVRARLDVANEAQLIDRLARDIAQLSGTEGRLKFQLNPEHLGSLHVEVEQRAEGVSLRFGTETEGARQVIADAQHRLVSEARAQGMRIAETHVDLSGQNQQGGGRGREAQPQPIVITSGQARDSIVEAVPDRPGVRDRFA